MHNSFCPTICSHPMGQNTGFCQPIKLYNSGTTGLIADILNLGVSTVMNSFMQSCIKFNSSSIHSVELTGQFKFSLLGKNWTLTSSQLMDELFWVATQKSSGRMKCPLLKKRRNFPFFLSWQPKTVVPSLFIGGHSSPFELHLSCNSKKLIHELGRS